MIFWSYCLYKTIKSPKLIIHSFYHDLWVITSYYEWLRVSSNFSYNGFCTDCQLYCLRRNCSSKAAGHPMWWMFALESSNMHRYVTYVSMLLLFLIFQVTTYLLIKHFYLRIFFFSRTKQQFRMAVTSTGVVLYVPNWTQEPTKTPPFTNQNQSRNQNPMSHPFHQMSPGRPESCWHQFRLQLQRRYLRNSGAVFKAGTSQADR